MGACVSLWCSLSTPWADLRRLHGEKVFEEAIKIAHEKCLISSKTDVVIATAGTPYGTMGAANVIRVLTGDGGKPPANLKIA